MSKTEIEWATHTENWLAGCTKVSPACTNCYAESMTGRLATMPHAPLRYRDGVVAPDKAGRARWTGAIRFDVRALAKVFDGLTNAKTPRRVFANSMSDTFHADVPPESLAALASHIQTEDVIGKIPRAGHVLMLLTKRPENALAWQRDRFPDGLPSWVWIGCTVEDQQRADERIPLLVQIETAGVRFLSCEPMVGPIDLLYACFNGADSFGQMPGIGWVICGGESGPNARPMHPAWAKDLRDQCSRARVPFHFKQWGEWDPAPGHGAQAAVADARGGGPHKFTGATVEAPADVWMYRTGKKAAGRLLDGVEHNGWPAVRGSGS